MGPGKPPKKHTVRNIVVGVVIGVFLVIGGCTAIVGGALSSIDDNDATKKTTDGATSAPAASTEPVPTEGDSPYDPTTPPAVEETTPAPEEPNVAKVGAAQWFNYENGLQVQVTKVARYKLGQYAVGGTPGGPGVIVTVTIKNGSKETADLTLTTVKLAYGANGDQAEEVFDSEHNLGSGFEGSATPGKAKTAKFAFAVPKGRQTLDIEVQPGFLDYESVHFEGTVK
jgi:hypothetical protein